MKYVVQKIVCSKHIRPKYLRFSQTKSGKNDGKTEIKNLEACTISDCMIDPCKPEPKVVIIGAGIAGLSAAQRLTQCGINNFSILEATNRYFFVNFGILTFI